MYSPVDRGNDHASAGGPRNGEELCPGVSLDADVFADVVDFVDALPGGDCGDDASDGDGYGGKCRKGEVDGVDAAAAEEEECGDTGEHGEAGKADSENIDDEEAEKGTVDGVESIVNLVGPVEVGEVKAKRTNLEFFVDNGGEVEAFCQVSVPMSRSHQHVNLRPGLESVQLVTLRPALGFVALGLYWPSQASITWMEYHSEIPRVSASSSAMLPVISLMPSLTSSLTSSHLSEILSRKPPSPSSSFSLAEASSETSRRLWPSIDTFSYSMLETRSTP